MSAKTSHARREAFFRALAATGNQTIAAERAKVSRSWVTLHRAQDPGFRARMEAAVAEARAALAALREGGGGMAPAAGWGSLDGEELVMRGGNGRRTQIARARVRQWTPRVETRFLSVLAATCNVKAACAEVGLTPASAYGHARRWERFAEAWRQAVETGYVRIEAQLIEEAGRPMDAWLDETAPGIPPMTVGERIHLLHMHKHAVRGMGKRPGRMGQAPDWETARASILRKIDAIERADKRAAEAGGEAERARDRRAWERRRDG